MNTLLSLDRRTLRDRVAAVARRLVVTGVLRPGAHVVESTLSDELGVSRGTIREALRPLEVEGLLVADGRGHLSVRFLSPREVENVFAVRTALELLAASLLANSVDRSNIVRRLRAALEPLRDAELDFADQIAVDLGFHELMCRLTENETLLTSWRLLLGQLEMVIIGAGASRASERMRYDEHLRIVDAIDSGDVELTRGVLSEHMTLFRSKYVGDARAFQAPAN